MAIKWAMSQTDSLSFTAEDAILAALSLAHALNAENDGARLAAYIETLNTLSTTRLDFITPLTLDMAAAPDGFDAVLELIGDSLSGAQAETCYALAADFIAQDTKAAPEQMRFLERLGESLTLDRLTRAAFDRAALARHGALEA